MQQATLRTVFRDVKEVFSPQELRPGLCGTGALLRSSGLRCPSRGTLLRNVV